MMPESDDKPVELSFRNDTVYISADSQVWAGIIQPEKSTEAAMPINPRDMKRPQRRSVVASQMFFCGAAAADGDVVKASHNFIVSREYRKTVAFGIYEHPGLRFICPACCRNAEHYSDE